MNIYHRLEDHVELLSTVDIHFILEVVVAVVVHAAEAY